MSDVIGRGVIEVSGDSSKLNAAIASARQSIKSLGESSKSANERAAASVDRYISRLETQNKTISMSARETELYKLALRGASNEQLKAADAALKMSESLRKNQEMSGRIKSGLVGFGAAAAAGLIAAAAGFDTLVKKAGEFQDLAEKTGDTAENIASLAVAAGTANTPMETIAAASAKLTKALTGVDDDSDAAGAAIKALGLSIDEFKNLSPTEQIEQVAKSLDGFKDGADKTAVAMALFGKSGADLLPFLKELANQGGRQVILTQEQIALADEYADKSAKLSTQIGLYAQAIAVQMLPAYNDLKAAFLDLLTGIDAVKGAGAGLGSGSEIANFADNGARALAFLIDAADGVVRVFQLVGKTIAGVSAIMLSPIQQSGAIFDAMKADLDEILSRPQYSDLLERRIAARKTTPEKSVNQAVDKPKLNYNGASGLSKSELSAIAKAQRDLDIENIRKSSEQLIGVYGNAERIMQAMRAANLIDEKAYYDSKAGFITLNAKAQESALLAEIDRLNRESLSGKDKLENDKKIVEAETKLAKLRLDLSGELTVNSIQEAAAIEKKRQSYLDAVEASKAYLDAMRRQNDAEISGMGMGEKSRERQSGRNQIENKFISRRQELEGDLRRNQITQDEYAMYLAVAKDTYEKELSLYESRNAAIDARQGDWLTGAKEAFANYADTAANIAKSTEQAFSNAFSSMEDAFVNFVKTGKFDFKSLAESILADLVRIQARAALSSATSGMGSWLGGLFSSSSGSDVIPMQAGGGYHTGGIVGSEPTFSRSISASLFSTAPRYHTGGIAGDEVPAILKKGEGVFTQGQMRALGGSSAANVQVNIIESAGSKKNGTVSTRDDGGKTIIDVFVEQVKGALISDVGSGGSFASAMEGQYALNRANGAWR